jgi:dienelactone hydrolase
VNPSTAWTPLCALVVLASIAGVHARAVAAPARPLAGAAQTVHFPSADGRTELVGYWFEPQGTQPHPVVVMLHGRAGPYSSNVSAGCTLVAPQQHSACGAATLSKRHAMWGEYWATHGYFALLVDSFGPRGRAHGYGRHSHDDPDRDAVNERTVRPLDAEAALAWLATIRGGVRMDRVMLQGWSNGASTALNVMYRQAQRPPGPQAPRFKAALALYPGCGPRALISQSYRADTNVWVLLGAEDEEVSPAVCADVLRRAQGGPVAVTVYEGATHDFDDPGAARQADAANRTARADAMRRAAAQFDALP